MCNFYCKYLKFTFFLFFFINKILLLLLVHVSGNLREDPESANLICYNHQIEDRDYMDLDMGESGEALMDDDGDDDGDDDVMIINDDYINVEIFCDQVLEVPLEPPPPLIPLRAPPSPTPVVMETTASSSVQPDEISPRGAIVEVRQRLTRASRSATSLHRSIDP